MLRAVVVALSVILLAAAFACALAGWHALPLAIIPAILLLGLLFERYLYKPIRSDPPGPEWNRTGERFADPRSGQPVVVYYNPRTGERRYVADHAASEAP